jgi:PleD family two-component response regulator
MRLMLRRALERDGYRVVEAADGPTAMAEFVKHQPDMVLLDAVMPGMDGFEVCQWLQEQPDGERCPCLLITGLNDDASVDRGFAAGATDFITKPIHWAVLRQRVRLLLQASRREYHLAYHDVLTGLPNRLKFADRLEHVLAQARRHGHGLAVLCIDLDRFKLVNDTWVMTSGTNSCKRWRAGLPRVCGKRISLHAWVRMNSSYCSTAYSPRIVSIRSRAGFWRPCSPHR